MQLDTTTLLLKLFSACIVCLRVGGHCERNLIFCIEVDLGRERMEV